MSAGDVKKITRPMNNLKYFMMIFLIGLISAYDSWLTHIYSKSIIAAERNLLSKFVMEKTSVDTFICIKMFGTLFVCSVLFCLVKTKFRSVVTGVLFFQLWLFYYLSFHTGDGYDIFGSFGDTPIYKMITGELESD
jgi:hypothetical protein